MRVTNREVETGLLNVLVRILDACLDVFVIAREHPD
jgi:hypothetical protein